MIYYKFVYNLFFVFAFKKFLPFYVYSTKSGLDFRVIICVYAPYPIHHFIISFYYFIHL